MDPAWIGNFGQLLLGLSALAGVYVYHRAQGQRWAYRNYKRITEMRLATVEAKNAIFPTPTRTKMIQKFREALARTDEFELQMRALEGPEPEFPRK